MPTVTLSGAQVTFDKVDKSNPTTVQGAPDLGATSEFNPIRSVLLFDTSGITGPVTVTSATFTATGAGGDTNAVNDIDFLKLLTEPVIGQATWNSYSTGNSWASDSGFNATDAVLAAAFTINDFLIAAANTNTSAGLIALCQDWINNPSNNKGLLVKFVDDTVANSAYVGFAPPTLEIVYTAGGAPSAQPNQRPHLFNKRGFLPGLRS